MSILIIPISVLKRIEYITLLVKYNPFKKPFKVIGKISDIYHTPGAVFLTRGGDLNDFEAMQD
jgi:hypothetical protein